MGGNSIKSYTSSLNMVCVLTRRKKGDSWEINLASVTEDLHYLDKFMFWYWEGRNSRLRYYSVSSSVCVVFNEKKMAGISRREEEKVR